MEKVVKERFCDRCGATIPDAERRRVVRMTSKDGTDRVVVEYRTDKTGRIIDYQETDVCIKCWVDILLKAAETLVKPADADQE